MEPRDTIGRAHPSFINRFFKLNKEHGACRDLGQRSGLTSNSLIEYDSNNILGRSANSIVYKGKFESRDVAVKKLNRMSRAVEGVVKEMEILKELPGHSNILKCFAIEEKPEYHVLAVELCDGSLENCVKDGVFPLDKREILRQATAGLDYLHKNRIVHRNLTPRNILFLVRRKSFFRRVLVKISDFRLSENMHKESVSASEVMLEGKCNWTPPEILLDEAIGQGAPMTKWTLKSDIFSLGCMYYYVLTEGAHPFGAGVCVNVNIVEGRYSLNDDAAGLMKTFRTLIERMICSNQAVRPTCEEILLHDSFVRPHFNRSMEDRIQPQKYLGRIDPAVSRLVDVRPQISSENNTIAEIVQILNDALLQYETEESTKMRKLVLQTTLANVPLVRYPDTNAPFPDDKYKLPTTESKGLFLIINVLHFDYQPHRLDACVDTLGLTTIFTSLGYQIYCCEVASIHWTKQVFFKIVKAFKRECCERKVNSFGVFLGSHGSFGHIHMFAEDDKIYLNDAIETLCTSTDANRHPKWDETPKMFFIQVCREKDDSPDVSANLAKTCLISFACRRGQYAYRDGRGSVYVKHLVDNLANFASREDLLRILGRTREGVILEMKLNAGAVQEPEHYGYNFEKLYFNMVCNAT